MDYLPFFSPQPKSQSQKIVRPAVAFTPASTALLLKAMVTFFAAAGAWWLLRSRAESETLEPEKAEASADDYSLWKPEP